MWPPTFKTVPTIEQAADEINQPHEDYPDRVSVTQEMIATLIEIDLLHITEFLIKGIHGQIMSERDDRGRYRSWDVVVGDHNPPAHYIVPELMGNFLPVMPCTVLDLQEWYIAFEEIHPFSDGNGRVGGVVIAAFSYLMSNDVGYMISGV